MLRTSVVGRAATAGLAVGALVVAGAGEPVMASPRSVQTVLDGGWVANAHARKVARADFYDWSRFRIGELRSPSAAWTSMICSYQASLWWESPSGKIIQMQNSSYHRGCSWVARMDFQNFEGGYPRGTKFPAKWKSNHTPKDDWIRIGKLT